MVAAGLLLIAGGALVFFLTTANSQSSPAFRLASITRGDLQSVISATGMPFASTPEKSGSVQTAGKLMKLSR